MRADVATAAHRELRDQTPPNGDCGPHYFCPACGEERECRGDMRAHLLECAEYQSFVVASVRRRDLEEILT